MKPLWRRTLAALAAAGASLVTASAWAQVTFYERHDFEGRSFTAQTPVYDFRQFGFNDRASSVIVSGQPWEVCERVEFGGQCMVLLPGHYRSLREMNMNDRVSSARPAPRDQRYSEDRYAPRPQAGQITFFEHEGYHGRAFNADGDVPDFRPFGFNDRASSLMVLGERWEACEHVGYTGRCVILRPGMYPSLASMGLNDRLSSVRAVPPMARFDDARYAPPPLPVYDWRRRPQDRLYEARVIGVHAVYGAPQQRCWVDREPVARGPNTAGAVIGAVVGANAGVERVPVQRCANVPAQGAPEYWDVSYEFRGMEHHVQTTFAPGPTITVNDDGEPRL